MKLAETVFDDDGKALGLLIWNDFDGVATFVPRRDRLAALRKMTWPCPIEARQAIQAFARGKA